MIRLLDALRKLVNRHRRIAGWFKKTRIGLKLNNLRLKLHYRKFTQTNKEKFLNLHKFFEDDLSRNTLKMIISKREKNVVSNDYQKHYNPQYFCFGEMRISYSEKEVFIDAGAYDGDTLKSYITSVGNNFLEYHCIEPDARNFKALNNFILKKQIKNVYTYNIGVWDRETQLGFSSNFSESSKLSVASKTKISVNSIDNLFSDKPVTFIKMDVEGAEYKALLGAKKTILKNKPKLAICVYHKPEDLIEIPEIIRSFDNSYRFFLRHHENNFYETVLYAY